jgi:hypothetical protein
VTPEFAEDLMNRVVDWVCSFVGDFEKFEVPQFKPKRP